MYCRPASRLLAVAFSDWMGAFVLGRRRFDSFWSDALSLLLGRRSFCKLPLTLLCVSEVILQSNIISELGFRRNFTVEIFGTGSVNTSIFTYEIASIFHAISPKDARHRSKSARASSLIIQTQRNLFCFPHCSDPYNPARELFSKR